MIINLTQHLATPEQITEGVVDMPAKARVRLCELLTFRALPSYMEVEERALAIVQLFHDTYPDAESAMIGGAGYLVVRLHIELKFAAIEVRHSFSQRASVETTLPDGRVRKVGDFYHLGFVEG